MSHSKRRPAAHWRVAATALAAGLGLAAVACSGAHEPGLGPTTGLPHSSVTPTANVPALLGSSIEVLRQRLGPAQPLPTGFSDPLMSYATGSKTLDSTAAFHTGGLWLVANYDSRSGQVHDLLLLGHHEDSLMRRASLRNNATGYLVLPVFYAGSHNRLMGLRIVTTN